MLTLTDPASVLKTLALLPTNVRARKTGVSRRRRIIKQAERKRAPHSRDLPGFLKLPDEAAAGELTHQLAHLKREEQPRKLLHGQPRPFGERVDVRRLVHGDELEHRALTLRESRGLARLRAGGVVLRLHLGREYGGGHVGRELGDHVLPGLNQLRARALDEEVRAERVAARDVAGDGEDLSTLLQREPRGDERARVFGSLHDDDAVTQPADDAVAVRKVLRHGRRPQRELRDERAAPLKNLFGEPSV